MPGILLVCESNIFGEKMRKHKVCGPWNQGLKGSGNGNCLCIMFHIAISFKKIRRYQNFILSFS